MSPPKDPFSHYDVVFSPAVNNARLATEIIHRLQNHTAPNVFSRVACAFDGKKNLYVLRQILFPEGSMTFKVYMSDRSDPQSKIFNVKLTKVADITPSDLARILQGEGAGMPIITTPLQALNVLVQQAAALRIPVHTKQKFFDSSGHQSFGGFEIWRGFFAFVQTLFTIISRTTDSTLPRSVRPTLGRLLLNMDMATAVMYQRGDLIAFICAYLRIPDSRSLDGCDENNEAWPRMKSVLKGLQVLLQHTKRLRTIRSIVAKAGEYEFNLANGQQMTVMEYFNNKYHYNLRYPRMPGVVTRKDEVIPFELCHIKEGQFFRKKTSPELMAQIMNFSKKKPNERLEILRRGMEQLQFGSSTFTQQAGLRVSPQPMSISGRLLNPPVMMYGGGSKLSPNSGSWNMVGRRLTEPKDVENWGVMSFARIELAAIQTFVTALANAMSAVGMRLRDFYPPIRKDSVYKAGEALNEFRMAAVKATGKPPTLLLIILPENAAPLKKTVKQFGDIMHGVVTQCVRVDKLMRANNQYHNNLVLKINAKLGGVNSIVDSLSFRQLSDGRTMVVGLDVTHPGPGVLRPSVAALVSSYDESISKYISRCAVQGPRTEIIEGLGSLMAYALQMFYRYRKHIHSTVVLPERIIVYRDGVSEGEIHKVVENEVQQIMSIIDSIYAKEKMPYRAKLTFIVVGKRHHIRFIPKEPRAADKSGNAPAGLFVDQEITSPGVFDFYLQSHGGLLGTSRPSHYIVVRDDNGFNADMLADFSYSLCYTYARATRSVSIPAPCYYADIACARADYHFDPTLRFDDDTSSTGGEFDLTPWIKGFQNVHKAQEVLMYFM
ncbi:Piwi-domain-containing protein [Fomitiporia mediterranea MF3/22]|uniref:Piwi-domain-containing protein n=1 Tax=Fomitiporia mediterranea (strain MF3/22) TaxID=694068 RepID=UPI0004409BEC|nr:Piwi-domain-containing protein [Fomitiporia mediterranea MF3/22]EJD05760.1 Piwi-domain-containing protein [Fomitiporia mediterranea MF3/22]